ncbi:MAG: HTTM domain-containing protein [Deltaproteobacteria bacterium]|nr:HTTM domain-containing protein [Deltaproteobacteria bacterium]
MRLINIFAKEINSGPMGMLRIVVGAAAIAQGFLTWEIMTTWLLPSTVHGKTLPFIPDISSGGVPFYAALWILAGLSFALGIYTHASGPLLFILIAYKLALGQELFSNHEYLLLLLTMLLTVGRSGSSFSLDARLRGKGRELLKYWPVWLIKVQISLMYVFTGIAKALSPSFVDGTVLREELILPTIFDRGWILHGLSLGVIAGEIAFPFLLWMKATRGRAIFFGTAFHVLTVLLIYQYRLPLVVFCLGTTFAYVVFLDVECKSKIVAWDDSCVFCATWVKWFKKLDWFRVHVFIGASDTQSLKLLGISTQEARDAIQYMDGTHRSSGIDGIKDILGNLPLTFLFASALSLPGVRAIGDLSYRLVARRRITCALGRMGES